MVVDGQKVNLELQLLSEMSDKSCNPSKYIIRVYSVNPEPITSYGKSIRITEDHKNYMNDYSYIKMENTTFNSLFFFKPPFFLAFFNAYVKFIQICYPSKFLINPYAC